MFQCDTEQAADVVMLSVIVMSVAAPIEVLFEIVVSRLATQQIDQIIFENFLPLFSTGKSSHYLVKSTWIAS